MEKMDYVWTVDGKEVLILLIQGFFVLILGYRMLMATSLPGVQHGAARHHQADRERQAEADPPGGEVRGSRQTPPSVLITLALLLGFICPNPELNLMLLRKVWHSYNHSSPS